MDAKIVMNVLRSAGLTVELDAGRLVVYPTDKLTDALRSRIREHRAGLVALLSQADRGECIVCGQALSAFPPPGEWLRCRACGEAGLSPPPPTGKPCSVCGAEIPTGGPDWCEPCGTFQVGEWVEVGGPDGYVLTVGPIDEAGVDERGWPIYKVVGEWRWPDHPQRAEVTVRPKDGDVPDCEEVANG